MKDKYMSDQIDLTPQRVLSLAQDSIDAATQTLSDTLLSRAEKISKELVSVVCYGNYDKVLDEESNILSFLQQESSKTENWTLHSLSVSCKKSWIELLFYNKSVE